MAISSNERFLVMRPGGHVVGEPVEDSDEALREAQSYENSGGAYVLPVHVPVRSDDESEPSETKPASTTGSTTGRTASRAR